MFNEIAIEYEVTINYTIWICTSYFRVTAYLSDFVFIVCQFRVLLKLWKCQGSFIIKANGYDIPQKIKPK